MDRTLLTLGISQQEHNNYVIVCFEAANDQILSIQIEKAEIVCGDTIYFDLGSLTEVEALREGDISYPVGNKRIVGRYSRKEFRDFFERKKVNIESFINNKNAKKFAIIKISSVHDLFINNGKLRMKFWANGVLNDFLLKDFRWIEYFNHLQVDGNSAEKLKHFKGILNNREHSTYAIIYKYEPYNVEWITGIHLI